MNKIIMEVSGLVITISGINVALHILSRIAPCGVT